jgi:Flp pilus assembly protein TadG
VRHGEKGTAIVEAAIVLPAFLLVLIGILEFGLIFNNYLILQNATREGARFGAIGSSEGNIEQRVRDYATDLNQSSLSVSVTGAEGNRGSLVTVDTSYPIPLITPMMSRIVGQDRFVLSAQAAMRLE